MYSKAKNFVSDIYSPVKAGVGALKMARDWISDHIDKLSSIPFVGDALKTAAQKAGEEPVFFGASLSDAGRLIDTANSYINSPYLLEGAANFDRIATQSFQSADRFIQGIGG